MIYHLLWHGKKGFGSGTVHSWDEKIVDATPALSSLIGHTVEQMMHAADWLDAKVTVESDDGNSRVELRRGRFS